MNVTESTGQSGIEENSEREGMGDRVLRHCMPSFPNETSLISHIPCPTEKQRETSI
jgi:hypothetical protein